MYDKLESNSTDVYLGIQLGLTLFFERFQVFQKLLIDRNGLSKTHFHDFKNIIEPHMITTLL